MEFSLTYEGLLKAAGSNDPHIKHKHQLRKVFHRQLKYLWKQHPLLRDKRMDGPGVEPERRVDVLQKRFPLGGYAFVPLVTQDLELTCRLDILFLRPDPPGDIIRSGDIDNRLKTLFDALRRPRNMAELGGYNEPDEDEKPLFSLLEDDALISRVSVETDMLLEAVNGTFDRNAARLVIRVYLKPYVSNWDNIGF